MSGRGPALFRTLSDLEQVAARRTAPEVWEYVQTGAGADRTQRGNREAFDRWSLLPRVLKDVQSVDLRVKVQGEEVAAPIFAAPTAYHGAIVPAGERATARAFARAGLLGVYSTLSSRSLEEIGEAAGPAPHWFQLYLQPEIARSIRLVGRAERAGFSALVVTVDAPMLGARDLQAQGGFAIVGTQPLGNGAGVRTPGRAMTRKGNRWVLEGVGEYSWRALDKVRAATDLPLIVKGVLTAADARAAVAHGASGIVVSNHGGRQLDRAVPALDALPSIVKAVGSRTEVYFDGGVRRASDLLIAHALGARSVGLGRPVLWALAAGGERGVSRLLELLLGELATSMVLLGCRSMSEVGRATVIATEGPLREPRAGAVRRP